MDEKRSKSSVDYSEQIQEAIDKLKRKKEIFSNPVPVSNPAWTSGNVRFIPPSPFDHSSLWITMLITAGRPDFPAASILVVVNRVNEYMREKGLGRKNEYTEEELLGLILYMKLVMEKPELPRIEG